MIEIGIQNTEIGKMKVTIDGEKVIGLTFLEDDEEVILSHHFLIKETFIQLQEYLEGKRKEFTVPIKLEGTPFQISVLEELLKIPYGETTSYEEIAKRIHRPKATRAVGNAIHRNPILIIIPCHRVIFKNKSLGGYAFGLKLKECLLNLEQENNR